MIKDQEYSSILNIYVPNNRALKYMMQRLVELKEEIENPLLDKNVNVPFSK